MDDTQSLASRRPSEGELPIIDMAALWSDDRAAWRGIADLVGDASRGIGFFYVTGHGIGEDEMERVFAASRQFFDLPETEKAAVSITKSMHNRGYVALEGESLDPERMADIKEAYNIGLDLPPDDPDLLAGRPFFGVNQWPDLPEWRDVMLGYYARMRAIGERLHIAFALDLGLADDFFAPYIDKPIATLRILHYPPHPGAVDPKQLGCAPHTDYGAVTILAQDGVEGLQVQARNGEWLDAPPIDGAFLCNIGDLMMRWSNDIFVSTPHRVINRSGRERYSIAFFFDSNEDAPVECLPTCVGPARPPRYAPTTGGRYLAERLNATYAFRRSAGPD